MLGWSVVARCHSRCVGLAFAKHVKGASPLESNTHLPSYVHAFKHAQATRSLQQRWQRCHSSNTPGAESRKIDPPDVRELAKMAHISVTDEEVREWEPQLAKIVDWFAQLQAVDVEGVLPAVRADLPDENVTRKDEAVRYEDREGLMKQVPEMEGQFVKVPKIL
ncbi:hypothetical protein CVIRNUC_000492 [Coccomyxa viridis]|uniref:Glutamyl-tRNA(Gln) amidotransferase subunit C, chloroplastic/mitochondrial n=1 Tax=Coccomyxa viridis TaxID=1274662 RepID=A0AAV1HSW6_9CHLO|nr:hypothetical protein CVIRNUC_000492 [Coccomyxa viridis]